MKKNMNYFQNKYSASLISSMFLSRLTNKISLSCACFIFIGCLVFTGQANADELRNRDKTEEMLVLLGAQDQVNLYLYNLQRVYESKFDNVETTPEVTRLVIEHRNDLFELIGGLLSWDAQKEIYIDAYQERLSEQDVVDVVSFLKTPAGQKSLSSQKEVQASINKHNQEGLQNLSPKIESLTIELKEEMQKLIDDAKSAKSS